MATRREDAPALLFEDLDGDAAGARVLTNMLGASKERYALAVGLDPDLSIAEMIAATRGIMKRRIAPVRVPREKGARSTRSSCAATRSISPRFRRRNSGRATAAAISAPATSRSRASGLRPHQCRRATGRCCTGRDESAFIARPASTACSTARHGGRAASRARWWRPMGSTRCCSWSARRRSARTNPNSTLPAASWDTPSS